MIVKDNVIKIPKLNPNDDHVKIVELYVNNGDYVEAGQAIASIETSKTTVELETTISGYLKWHYGIGDFVKFEEVIASLYENHDLLLKSENDKSFHNQEIEDILLSNEAKSFVSEHNIDISLFKSKGLVNLEMAKEISRHMRSKSTSTDNNDINNFPYLTIEDLDHNKLSEIKTLEAGQLSALTSSLTIVFESHQIRQALSRFKNLNKRILPYIILILVKQLKVYPKFTSYFKNNSIYYYNEINLGLAIDIGKDLKVLVLRNFENKAMLDIHFDIIDSIAKYHNDTLELNDLMGSTVTVSDLSNDNIMYFQPLLNVNQAVIFGIGGDEKGLNYPMSITVTFDHRVLSGQEVAEFLNKLKTQLLIEYENIEG